MKTGQKIAIGVGLGSAALGIGYLLTRKAPPPPPPPGLAQVFGTVADATTGTPLGSVLVTANGLEVVTDSRGQYILTNLEPGTYTIRFSKTNYEEGSMSITLSAGESRELNVQMTSLAPLVATLYGRVIDAQTGAALQGVEILLDTLFGGVTDANGNYLIEGIPPGTYTVTFRKTGYQQVIM